MSDMTEQEAWEIDELLTKTTPEVSPTVNGLIKAQLTYNPFFAICSLLC
jgi:hypothetical protein